MADLLLRSLREAVARETFTSKVVLSSNAAAAHTLLRRLALSGTPWVNIRCATPTTLAREMATAGLDRDAMVYADPTMTLLLIGDLLASTPDAVAYLGAVPATPGTLGAVHRSLTVLRAHGVRPADVRGAVLDPAKGRALAGLLEAFERELAARGWADDAEVYRRAMRAGADDARRDIYYLVPSGLLAEGLAREFLDSLPADRVAILAQDELPGLPSPDSRWTSTPPADTEDGPLRGLFTGRSRERSVELFAAADAAAEVREILRRALMRGLVWDDVEVIPARTDPYVGAFHEVTRRLGIPVTFGGGVPAAWTRPGRAAVALATWVRDGFPARALADALAAGDVVPPEGDETSPLTGSGAARLLRRAGIGWRRERYEPALSVFRSRVERSGTGAGPTEEESAGPDHEMWARRRLARVDALCAFIRALLARCPEPANDGLVALNEVCAWLGAALDECAGVVGDLDSAAKAVLSERLALAARWGAGRFHPREAADRVLSLLADLRVGASGPRPGHVHVASEAGASFSGRPCTFVVGLDEAAFAPGSGADPLLLDEERAALTPGLPDSVANARQRLYRFGLTLAAVRGRVSLSYSVREAGADRTTFPSPILLQAFRLQSGRPEAGYAELQTRLGGPIGAFPAAGRLPLDHGEAWLSAIATAPVLADARAAALAAYPHLARGVRLRRARDSVEVTPYDGQIEPDPDLLDPRRKRDMVVSASRLETLALCPLAYLFRYVLGIQPLEEVEREPGRWLDAAGRGSLLHTVYRRFYEELGGPVTGGPDEERLLRAVCSETIAQYRQEVPPPSEAVYGREREQLLGEAALFLEVERRESASGAGPAVRPLLFELPFGMGPGSVPAGSTGSEDPVDMAVGRGAAIRVRGRIDRVDRVGGHEYRVWDYKTGSAYEEGGAVLRGRRLQHVVYAEVAEHLLRSTGVDRDARVVSAGYRFPTERGEGRTWTAHPGLPAARAGMTDALTALLDLVAAGTFVAAEDARGCPWCDFKAACDAKQAADATKRKLQAGDTALDPLRAVAEIE